MQAAQSRHNKRRSNGGLPEEEHVARKREKNRLAQQVYRRKQKERMQALEAAVAQSSISMNDASQIPFENFPDADMSFDNSSTSSHLHATLQDTNSDGINGISFQQFLCRGLGQKKDTNAQASTAVFSECDSVGSHRHYSNSSCTESELTCNVAIDPSMTAFAQCGHSEKPGLPNLTASCASPTCLRCSATVNSPGTEIRVAEQQSIIGSSAIQNAIPGSQHSDKHHILRPFTPHKASQTNAETSGGSYATTPSRPGGAYTALHFAIKERKSSIVKVLLDHGASTTALDKQGNTPLHLAVLTAVESVSEDAETDPSHLERSEGAKESLEILLNTPHVDMYATDMSGRSILFLAVASGNETVTKLILDAMNDKSFTEDALDFESETVSATERQPGAHVPLNEPDLEGKLPLHIAITSGSASMVKLLLSYGADINN